ncbi:hypothetical protein ACQKWADRAFT_279222 [Trichoderma austrokoningii]
MPSAAMPPQSARPRRAMDETFYKLTGGFFCKSRSKQPVIQHPPVYCIPDLLETPPQYQQQRSTPPVAGELQILQAQLYRCQSQSSFGNNVERELLDADAAHLSDWIEHLEWLVYMKAATTIPSRYKQEATFFKVFRKVFRRNKRRQT